MEHQPWQKLRCKQIQADMEALTARLIQAERALVDTRLQISAEPKVAPLMDTRTSGKAHTFTGEYKDWPELSFQLKHFAG